MTKYALQARLVKTEDILGNTETLRVYWVFKSIDDPHINCGQAILSFARSQRLLQPPYNLTKSDWVVYSRTLTFLSLREDKSKRAIYMTRVSTSDHIDTCH